jgi:NADH-quinone oxidoreductase subunit G
MPTIKINNKEIEVEDGLTVIQACEIAGIEIPRFCYHEKLKIAGNCRMCLVEMEKAPKPVASCAQIVADGMSIHTNTPMVKKAREGVMEFLLINHPLDCPICDQGGMCDLQDQAMKFGKGDSRFNEDKRAVPDKDFGPLIKTHMTRCIHCTRCVRFLEDIAGTNELGAINRGEDMEISTVIAQGIQSELSGNIIDLCPVGALTSKPYQFKWRNWELKDTHSIDVMDAIGSNIRISSYGNEVMRVLPMRNDDINEEWLSDKTRFSYDGLKYQRLDRAYSREKNILKSLDLQSALTKLAQKIKTTNPEKIGAIAGDMTDVETMLCAKDFLQAINCDNFDCRQNQSQLGNEIRPLYLFNSTIKAIEAADHCLLIGCNPRHEATIINARIRKAFLENNLTVAVIGEKHDLTYPYSHLGNNPWVLKQIADGNHPLCKTLKKSKKPMLILGEHLTTTADFEAIFHYCQKIVTDYNYLHENWSGFNILHTAASRVGGLDIGFIPQNKGFNTNEILQKCEIIFLFGADEIDLREINTNSFIVYFGHHGDKIAGIADMVIPTTAFTEKKSTFVNLEGRIQSTFPATEALNEAQDEWQSILDLAAIMEVKMPYKNQAEINEKITAIFSKIQHNDKAKTIQSFTAKNKIFTNEEISSLKNNYYLTNSICRHSKIMRKCAGNL